MAKTGLDRPMLQVPALEAVFGMSVRWNIVSFYPDRKSALSAEEAAVKAATLTYGQRPLVQIRP